MNNAKIIKKVLPLLRENESIVDIPKKCIWNFLYIYIIAVVVFISLLNLNIYCETFREFWDFVLKYNLAEFYVDDIWFFINLIAPIILFIISLAILFFLPYVFCYEKIVITNERLIIFSFLGLKIIEKVDICPAPPNFLFDLENRLSLENNDIFSMIYKSITTVLVSCAIKRNIKNSSITYDTGLDKLWIRSVVIKTVSSGDYTIAFYNYKDICEKIGYR